MVTIYWHCLEPTASDEDEKFVAGALDQLAQHLKGKAVKLSISIKRLRDEPKLARKVDETLDRLYDESYTFSECDAAMTHAFFIANLIGETYPAKLLVYCSPDSHIAVAAQRKAPHAKRGATCAFLAAVYSLNSKSTIFHEALHLLGADDCYIEDKPCQKKPDCNFERCIMDYNPAEQWCENWPFICERNIEQLK
ncbi:MAG: hypothetical protein KAY65_06915 [Planctomycetes bacterium]|nr:hypothetical protein [Planctomycetota bacterium]